MLYSGSIDNKNPLENFKQVHKNIAFVFIKPHANNKEVFKEVEEMFNCKGIFASKLGELDGKEIDEKKFIDNHYYSIANKASLSLPKDLNPPENKRIEFKEKFGISWEELLEKDMVHNALDACKK